VDKLTYAALEATLLAYIKQNHDAIPAVRIMRLTKESIRERAESLRSKLTPTALRVDLLDGESLIGGGAAPSATLPTCLLALTHATLSAAEISSALRNSTPPIIVRIDDNRVLLDLRTVFPNQDDDVLAALLTLT
jgi:L-seryl-tRNA(Ser) seleniumtransferase